MSFVLKRWTSSSSSVTTRQRRRELARTYQQQTNSPPNEPYFFIPAHSFSVSASGCNARECVLTFFFIVRRGAFRRAIMESIRSDRKKFKVKVEPWGRRKGRNDPKRVSSDRPHHFSTATCSALILVSFVSDSKGCPSIYLP